MNVTMLSKLPQICSEVLQPIASSFEEFTSSEDECIAELHSAEVDLCLFFSFSIPEVSFEFPERTIS